MTEQTRILYVDDEPDIRLIVELALRIRPGIEVRTADSGEAALEVLSGGDWRPDLTMVDVMMPGLTGPDVLAAMLDDPELAKIPVVFVTARARPQDVRTYIEQGAKGVITKPFDPLTLADQVLALIA
ncbi:response regulator [Sphingomonas histidinilytica]|jgi:CheY-like chemotaxis protein|uniref:Response regulator receiver domain-containing protein n=1 Tax=Rhizorhabdus histidinilytica TaxID=439228 RepID=A0A1T5BSY2_9SPHN|nr:response regulator [Rhizorhabdus histidinilytica]MBO9377507.1 response regulator [Rhizorhabdus histidinilytica]QEH77489.1 response regulator [Sphingomonas sp. C8-2]SKB50325.1 Response regulator receiver domain-containing protein [Rhizorhabdus histidinilytica]